MIRRLIRCSCLCLLLLAASAVGAEPVRLIAHRGGVVSDQIIENNRAAIEEAVRRGYWMVEADIRCSKDGVPIVHHDRTFQRYYGVPRAVSDMEWAEIAQLRSTSGNERPLKFTEYLDICKGRLRVMLDVKAGDHPPDYFASIEAALAERGMLKDAYLIGTDPSKEYFRDKLRVSADPETIFAAAERGEPVADRYFIFNRGSRITEPIVRRAQELNVTVVAAINRFRYPDDEATALALAKDDIARLRALGVTEFQIDSQYDVWFLDKRD